MERRIASAPTIFIGRTPSSSVGQLYPSADGFPDARTHLSRLSVAVCASPARSRVVPLVGDDDDDEENQREKRGEAEQQRRDRSLGGAGAGNGPALHWLQCGGGTLCCQPPRVRWDGGGSSRRAV